MYYSSILFFHIKVYSIVYRPDKWIVGLMLIWEKDVHKMHLLISPSRRWKYLVHCIYICKFFLTACEFYMIVKFTQFEEWYTYLMHDRFKNTTTWTHGEGLLSMSYKFFFNLFLSPHGKCQQVDLLLFSPIWSYLGSLFILYKDISSYFHYPLCIDNILTSSVFTLLLQKVYSQSEKGL